MTDAAYCDHLVQEFEAHIHQLGPDNRAAFIAEPIMGAGGELAAAEGHHHRVSEICKRYDMSLRLFIASLVRRLSLWSNAKSDA